MRKTRRETNRLAAMAAPPNIATGFWCQRSGRGLATNPTRRAMVRAIGTKMRDSANASANGAAMELVISNKSWTHVSWGDMVARLAFGGPDAKLLKPAFEADKRPQAMADVCAGALMRVDQVGDGSRLQKRARRCGWRQQ